MIPQLNLLNNKIKLKMIIAVYENDYDYHMEYHPVKDNIIQSARNFSIMTMTEILKNLKLIRQKKEKTETITLNKFIPNNLVYLDVKANRIMFRTKARSQEILFNHESGLDTGVYSIPNLLFVYRYRAISVYAFNKWENEKTKLYNIGLPNIDDKCDVCMGNVLRDSLSEVSDIMKQTETSFWNSYFGHWRYESEEDSSYYRNMWHNNQFICSKRNFISTLVNLDK